MEAESINLMQSRAKVSLNAIRVFETAARLESLKAAGNELFVTPGAVSHQIKQLEESFGVLLFHRKNNGITLTDAGRQFYRDIQPAIQTIDNATSALVTDANELVLRVSISLAVRCLIPMLEHFKKRHPQVRIKLETSHMAKVALNAGVDVAISYYPITATGLEGKTLTEDHSIPLVTPALLSQYQYTGLKHCRKLPAVSSTPDNWDWRIWSQASGLSADDIKIVDQFDTDDAAIHAAVTGMGMVLMPPWMAKNELAAGTLVTLPEALSVKMGSYQILRSPRPGSLIENFEEWLIETWAE